MTLLILRAVGAALVLLIGVVALSAVRYEHAFKPGHREAAWLTGVAFTLLGAIMVVHDFIAAPWAFFSGPDTAVYGIYRRWAPAGDHSQGFLLVAYGVLLLLLALRPSSARFPRFAIAGLLLGTLLGAFAGWMEGPLAVPRHDMTLAISNTVQLLVLSAALLAALWAGTMDRYFWSSLLVYNMMHALNVGWFSALAWGAIPGAWRPSLIHLPLYQVPLYLLMLALLLRRFVLARRGVREPALSEAPPPFTSQG